MLHLPLDRRTAVKAFLHQVKGFSVLHPQMVLPVYRFPDGRFILCQFPAVNPSARILVILLPSAHAFPEKTARQRA